MYWQSSASHVPCQNLGSFLPIKAVPKFEEQAQSTGALCCKVEQFCLARKQINILGWRPWQESFEYGSSSKKQFPVYQWKYSAPAIFESYGNCRKGRVEQQTPWTRSFQRSITTTFHGQHANQEASFQSVFTLAFIFFISPSKTLWWRHREESHQMSLGTFSRVLRKSSESGNKTRRIQ